MRLLPTLLIVLSRLGSVLLCCAPLVCPAQTREGSGWPFYGHDSAGSRFWPVKQINRANVKMLRVAWTFRTGALNGRSTLDSKSTFEATPITVDGNLVFSTPYDHVIALDSRTARKLWEFDPHISLWHNYSEVTSRGVAAWRDPKAKPLTSGATRIFVATIDAHLFAIDAVSGEPCADFADNGAIDLSRDVLMRDLGDYQVTSAPSIAGDLIITGSSIGDNRAVDVERGIVRAFDARTGRLRWTRDPIPWAKERVPRTGAGNAWSTFSVDEDHGLVFIPTGSASPDYYGEFRKGDDKWANSVVALRAATGELVWGLQVVHHDLWDFDVASHPTLFTWKDKTPAIAITTKMGRIFVLNRLTGTPLIPVEEKPVPASDILGEDVSPTQPSSISTVSEGFTVADAFGPTPEDKSTVLTRLQRRVRREFSLRPASRGRLSIQEMWMV